MTDERDEPYLPVEDANEQAAAPPAETPKPKKKPAKAKSSKGKSAKGKGGKGSKGGLSIATHPRARAQVRRAKGWGGLGGFVITLYLSYKAGVPPEQVGIRALAAGAVGYLVAWGVTITIWRHLVLAEIRAVYEQRKAAVRPGTPIGSGGGGPKEDETAA